MQSLFHVTEISEYLTQNPRIIPPVLTNAVLLIFFARCILQGRFHRAAGIIILVLCIAILHGTGIDLQHHAPRTIELAKDISAGDLDLFVFAGEDALPLFYYYSTGFYIFALPFLYAGFSAATALQIVATIFFALMAFAIRKVFTMLAALREPGGVPARELAGMLTIVFVTSNYVYMNFVWRNAYPEAAVYALVPLVFLSLRLRLFLLSAALMCLQISIHPPVFPQAAAAALFGHLATVRHAPVAEAARSLAMAVLATVLAGPAWFWALRNKDSIAGVDALPVGFEDTFLTLSVLLEMEQFRAPGPYLLLLLGIVIWHCRNCLRPARLLLAGALAVLLMQLSYFRPLVVHIPLIDLGLFVWRWMFVAIWFGVLGLCLTWCLSAGNRFVKVIILLAGLQAGLLAGMQMRPWVPDQRFSTYFSGDGNAMDQWGFAEFYPNYGAPDARCNFLLTEQLRPVSFAEVRGGSVRSALTLAIRNGPVGNLGYAAGGAPAEVTGCGTTLFVHHPDPGKDLLFEVRPDVLTRHAAVRIFFPLGALLLVCLGLLHAVWRKAPFRAT